MANVTFSGKGSNTGWFPFGMNSGPKGTSKDTRNRVILVASAAIASIGIFFYCRYRKQSKLLKSKDTFPLSTRAQTAPYTTSPDKERLVAATLLEQKESKVDESARVVQQERRTPSPDHQLKSLAHVEGRELFQDSPVMQAVGIDGEERKQQAPSTPARQRPQTPDSAYGDVDVYQGTITSTKTPPKSVYGNVNTKVPSLNLDEEGRL